MIPPIKKILYATDLSKNSIYAFYHAVDLAKKYDAEVLIVHIVETISARTYGSLTDKLYLDQQKASLEVIKNRIHSFCQKTEERFPVCANLVSEIIVRVGDPVEEVLKTADERGCDLLVLGKHGKGFLEKTFLGSVSRAVLDRARKPAFLIPLPPEETDVWDEI